MGTIEDVVREVVRDTLRAELPALLATLAVHHDPAEPQAYPTRLWYSKPQAAQYLGVSVNTLNRLLADGLIRRGNPGGKARFRREWLEEFIEADATCRRVRPGQKAVNDIIAKAKTAQNVG